MAYLEKGRKEDLLLLVQMVLDGSDNHKEEFVAVNDDSVGTAKILTDKSILEFFQSSKNIIDADSDDENETN
ncbi:hypothetical protein TNCV_1490291 [Trichonephila clavipes]|nr:hypothetical protein TNCV_1490291 [Trichonephila clavipes]